MLNFLDLAVDYKQHKSLMQELGQKMQEDIGLGRQERVVVAATLLLHRAPWVRCGQIDALLCFDLCKRGAATSGS